MRAKSNSVGLCTKGSGSVVDSKLEHQRLIMQGTIVHTQKVRNNKQQVSET